MMISLLFTIAFFIYSSFFNDQYNKFPIIIIVQNVSQKCNNPLFCSKTEKNMPNNEELKPLINYDLNSSFIHEYCHHLLHIKKWVPENIHLTPVICYAPGDRYLARLITRKGNYEDGLQKKFFKDVFPKFPNAAFVDIGANIGVYTISAGVLGGKVFAVEPMPETLKSLSQSVAVNSLLDRVSVYPYGLMDKKSCVYPELFESGNNKGRYEESVFFSFNNWINSKWLNKLFCFN